MSLKTTLGRPSFTTCGCPKVGSIFSRCDASTCFESLGGDTIVERSLDGQWQFVCLTQPKATLPETNMTSHLKMDGWNLSFLLGLPIFRGELLVSRRVTFQLLGIPHLGYDQDKTEEALGCNFMQKAWPQLNCNFARINCNCFHAMFFGTFRNFCRRITGSFWQATKLFQMGGRQMGTTLVPAPKRTEFMATREVLFDLMVRSGGASEIQAIGNEATAAKHSWRQNNHSSAGAALWACKLIGSSAAKNPTEGDRGQS